MFDGKIIEQGDHQFLMEKEGVYYKQASLGNLFLK